MKQHPIPFKGALVCAHRHKGSIGAFVRRGVGTDSPELDITSSP